MEIDRRMMRRALALASLGRGSTSPNPLVGAVIARNERVVGQGFHRRAGEPHAEVVALDDAGKRARGATLYANLEPCCHTGRTPPCVVAIVNAGISRVVAAMRDPDPRVNGGGFRWLKRRGVKVEVGLLEREAVRLNESFVKVARKKLPFVTLKGAMSLDGRIATRTGDSKWITSAESRAHARLLRHENDVVVVGIGTVIADDPLLTARPGKSSLIRVVMDTHLRMSPHARLATTVDKGPVVVFAGPDAPRPLEDELRKQGVEVRRMALTRGRPDLRKCLEYLADCGVTRVLVEGGGELHGAFIDERIADRLLLYIAPRLIGGKQARPLVGGEGSTLMSQVKELKHHRLCRIGREIVVEAELPS